MFRRASRPAPVAFSPLERVVARRRRARPSAVLERELAALIVRRQHLRDRGASEKTLERNRRKIVRRQRELAYALIDAHSPELRRMTA